ncbi:MAG: hypothetical protein ABS41_02140 [Arenimonas sp. SCN 70-307]|uniref:UDP-2,3-diacylglucosamine diphosphatase n=1 Tax=Arenimonas sp. SCN 70-307 TaxID=1660089 RepID=UPI00086D6BAD|nr:UDP-2,3-diacylglucosamine diphosphatase [Arenimonas sp. SCN 70-307]ODS64518.1 MAG: hypothetical protein ABS41_02140 [Arenimonas sp. SCN 70-307]
MSAAAPHRAVFISDVHLGSGNCHAAELAAFLGGLRTRRLYLVGDIVDLWWMAQRRAAWGADQHRVVEALHALARAGTELVYVPGNRGFNRLRRRLGLRYWSLADFLKSRSGAAERYIARFVQAGLDDARRRGLDGIVCGHIHRAALVERDGLVYANDGDWVESLTALAEQPDGSLVLLRHDGAELARLPSRRPRPERLSEAA